jgi:hypothetical protein
VNKWHIKPFKTITNDVMQIGQYHLKKFTGAVSYTAYFFNLPERG